MAAGALEDEGSAAPLTVPRRLWLFVLVIGALVWGCSAGAPSSSGWPSAGASAIMPQYQKGRLPAERISAVSARRCSSASSTAGNGAGVGQKLTWTPHDSSTR